MLGVALPLYQYIPEWRGGTKYRIQGARKPGMGRMDGLHMRVYRPNGVVRWGWSGERWRQGIGDGGLGMMADNGQWQGVLGPGAWNGEG